MIGASEASCEEITSLVDAVKFPWFVLSLCEELQVAVTCE